MCPLTIVIPAYNEQLRLPATLDIIARYAAASGRCAEILVVDDGSTDGTAGVVERSEGAIPGLRLIRNPGNRGKGYAVRHGMLAAQGEWILFTDADLSTPIEELEKLFDAARAENAAVVIGSRALRRELIEIRQPLGRELSGRMFNLLMRGLTGLNIHDTQCGFKLYRRDAAEAIFRRQILDGFSFDVEDLVIANRHGFKVAEVPVRWRNAEGTRVRLVNGLQAFGDLWTIRKHLWAGRYD